MLGLPDSYLKSVVSNYYPNLSSMKFTKAQCEVLLMKIVDVQKNRPSSSFVSIKNLTMAVQSCTIFLFRCLNRPNYITASTIIGILYNEPGMLDRILKEDTVIKNCPVLSNRPKITKRTAALMRSFSNPLFSLFNTPSLPSYEINFLYPYLTNTPIQGNALQEILVHFRPNAKGIINATELRPFYEFLPDVQEGEATDIETKSMKHSFKKKMKIHELILALPLDEPLYEAFSLLFSPITGLFFMNTFKKFDCDGSGELDNEEALALIKEMLNNSVANTSVYSTRRKSFSPELHLNIESIAYIVVQSLFTSFNRDSISLTDLGYFLNIQQNFLNKYMLSTGVNANKHHELFKHYDQDGSGFVDGEEISELVRDIVSTVNGDDVDVIVEEVDVAKSLLLGGQDGGGKMSEEDVGCLIPSRTACFTARANSICDAEHDFQ